MPPVLVADDDSSVRRVLQRTLEAAGRAVVLTRSAAEARAAAAAGTFSLAFVDVGLGADDGVLLARELREKAPALRLILMSGDPDSLDRARLAGFDLRLPKPFDAAALRDVLSRASTAS